MFIFYTAFQNIIWVFYLSLFPHNTYSHLEPHSNCPRTSSNNWINSPVPCMLNTVWWYQWSNCGNRFTVPSVRASWQTFYHHKPSSAASQRCQPRVGNLDLLGWSNTCIFFIWSWVTQRKWPATIHMNDLPTFPIRFARAHLMWL